MPKYKIHYSIKGEIEIDASNEDEAIQKFYDRVGITTDEIYENATDDVVHYAEIEE